MAHMSPSLPIFLGSGITAGIGKVALLDFDVHHGNGTQACVGRVVPQIVQYPVATPLCEGALRFQSFHPWFGEKDSQNILFARYLQFFSANSLGLGKLAIAIRCVWAQETSQSHHMIAR